MNITLYVSDFKTREKGTNSIARMTGLLNYAKYFFLK
jgi:hypothetical protein